MAHYYNTNRHKITQLGVRDLQRQIRSKEVLIFPPVVNVWKAKELGMEIDPRFSNNCVA
jgi:hypothetical protein